MRSWTIVGVLAFGLAMVQPVSAKLLYKNNFDGEALGALASGWEKAFAGTTAAKVIVDPANASNKCFSSSDLAMDKSRHDVGGSIHAVGSADWTDYVVDYDAYFPADFYMGTLFRYQNDKAFYLFDRRAGGEAGNFDLWYHKGGSWTGIQRAGKFTTAANKWYRFRLVIKGANFEAYAAEKSDATAFTAMKPIVAGTNADLKTGRFALYGLIYIDNLVIGETVADVTTPVEPAGKTAALWAELKSR
jgi:hypothetical protein